MTQRLRCDRARAVCFNIFDTNGNGFVSREEFFRVLTLLAQASGGREADRAEGHGAREASPSGPTVADDAYRASE